MTVTHPTVGEVALPADMSPFAAFEAALIEYRAAVVEHEGAKGGVCFVELARARCMESEARLKLAQVGLRLRLKV